MEGIKTEKGPERIPTKEEVLEVIARYIENATFVRELSDEQGLYLLEVKVQGEKTGETIQYEYIRKGKFPNHNESVSTVIHIVYYENEIPVGGHDVANFDSETGEWKDVK
ncbi:MAG: hypothetical protein AAB470_02560 [Patescibacteria group bacterium]